MKKIISLIVPVFLLACFMTGCNMVKSGEKAVEQGVQKVEEGISTVMKDEKAMMDKEKNMLQEGGTNKDGSSPSNEEKSKFIGEEKAKELALKKVGVGADQVKFDRVELDYDDGVWQYEIDFRHSDIEYDIDINAENGEILSFEKETKI